MLENAREVIPTELSGLLETYIHVLEEEKAEMGEMWKNYCRAAGCELEEGKTVPNFSNLSSHKGPSK
jgi:hypothetical protein